MWSSELLDLGSYKDTVYKHQSKRNIKIEYEAIVPHFRKSPAHLNVNKIQYHAEMCFSSAGTKRGIFAEMTIETREFAIEINFRGPEEPRVRFNGKQIEIEERFEHLRKLGRFDLSIILLMIGNHVEKLMDAESAAELMSKIESVVISSLNSGIQRVSSGRTGPKRFYQSTSQNVRVLQHMTRMIDSVTPDWFEQQELKNQEKMTKRISSWLERLDIARNVTVKSVSPYHNAIFLEDCKTGVVSNLSDYGYGASQVMPIFMALASKSMSPVFIEQPEIHLHPSAQVILSEILCEVSRERQLIVETHSEHIINGVRKKILRERMAPGDATVIYVQREANGTTIRQIEFDNSANFKGDWPNGFFDERYRDTMEILSMQKGK